MLGHFHLQTESKFGTFSLTSHKKVKKMYLYIENNNVIIYNNVNKMISEYTNEKNGGLVI